MICYVMIRLLSKEQKEFEQAEVYYKEALQIRKMFLGETHHDTVVSKHNLGIYIYIYIYIYFIYYLINYYYLYTYIFFKS